ncbi:MAG: hypothetical protein ABI162_01535 [Luteolibacter sp.]
MLNARSIQGILIIFFALFIAIWLGLSVVTNQTETLIQIAGAALLITAIFLGRRIWLLLIFFSALNVLLIRGSGTTEIGQVLFLVFSLILFLMRKLRMRFQFGEKEFWALLVIACIVQAYLRNPVGLNVFGGGSVGGRPYVAMILSISTAAGLSILLVDAKELKWAMYLTLLGGFLGIPGTMLRYGDATSGQEGYDRIPVLGTAATLLARWLTSRISPLRACVHPLWGLVLLASIAAAAGSGYRNSVAAVGFVYILGIAYRGGVAASLCSAVGGSFFLLLLALVNLNFPLPGNIQRALSPLPGTWEERYRKAADDSTDWRVEMWKEALTSDRWIHDKVLGDGIGMTMAEYEGNQLTDSRSGGGRAASGLLVQQETMMITGSYHSGPVHTIRAVGYVGLAILLLAMIRVAVHAHRQILRCRGTEWYGVALFFCIPLISQPFYFTLIFGEYQTGVAGVMMGIAMIRLLENNLPLPAWKKTAYQPFILKSQRVLDSNRA